jgi:hypothetical protein
VTIRELLEQVRVRYPDIQIHYDWTTVQIKVLQLESRYKISLSYGKLSCCGARLEENPLDSVTVEVAIFDPNDEWILVEGMVTSDRKTGVFCWLECEKVFQIIDYLKATTEVSKVPRTVY